MVALDAAQVDRDLGFERGIDRFGQIVPQQDVFRRNGCVRLQFEYPMSIGLLQGDERAGCHLDAVVDGGRRRGRFRLEGHAVHDLFNPNRPTRSAARLPDRIAPSIVAGKPVFVQSPASRKFLQAVVAAGRLAFCPGVAAKVARRSRTICHGGSAVERSATAATSRHNCLASVSRGVSSRRSAALIVTDNRPGNVKSHSIVPFTIPVMGASSTGGSKRKCALTMARNCAGVVRSGTRAAAMLGGTARITSASPVATLSSRKSSVVTLSCARPSARSRCPNTTFALCWLRECSGGATKTSPSPSWAISGRQALPPATNVSRRIAPARHALASFGSMLSAASQSGRAKRWYSVPVHFTAAQTVFVGEG